MTGSNVKGGSNRVYSPGMVKSNTGMSSTERNMKAVELTDRQKATLEAIRDHRKRFGMPPSRSELAAAIGVANQAGVDRLLAALAQKGWIRLLPARDRGIQLLREGAPILDPDELPEVAAGQPRFAGECPEPPRLDDFDTLTERFESKPDYFLRVKGDSMDRIGFNCGDIVAVRRDAEPRNGDVVVARIEDEITLKRFHRKDKDTIELEPASSNPAHQPIRVSAQTRDFAIAGVVVGAIVGARRATTDG